LIHELTFSKDLSKSLLLEVIAFLLDLLLFQLFFHQLLSNTQLKSGKIIKTVGKSVSLLTISSICLVTQSINQLGNDDILFCCILITSLKSQSPTDDKSKVIDQSDSHHENKGVIGSSENFHGKYQKIFLTTFDQSSLYNFFKVFLSVSAFLRELSQVQQFQFITQKLQFQFHPHQ